jgi:hypothetical protein
LAGGAADLEAIEASHVVTARSADHREAMRALKERRSPNFRGS